jgi:hypothetical protein
LWRWLVRAGPADAVEPVRDARPSRHVREDGIPIEYNRLCLWSSTNWLTDGAEMQACGRHRGRSCGERHPQRRLRRSTVDDFAGKFGRWIRVTIYWDCPTWISCGSHSGFLRPRATESRQDHVTVSRWSRRANHTINQLDSDGSCGGGGHPPGRRRGRPTGQKRSPPRHGLRIGCDSTPRSSGRAAQSAARLATRQPSALQRLSRRPRVSHMYPNMATMRRGAIAGEGNTSRGVPVPPRCSPPCSPWRTVL